MQDEDISEVVGQAIFEVVNKHLFIQGGITSLVVIATLIALRFVLVRITRGKREILDTEQRRWINRINNITTISIIFVLTMIWAPQLQTFALSLTAVAVAVVLITKELLMCLTGGFFRASTKPFDIGDWIVIDGGVTGEVMRVNAMTTRIEEIDVKEQSYQFTGKSIHIPNSRFLTVNVENANFIKSYIYYDVSITVPSADLDPAILMEKLREITEVYYAPFREAAIKFNRKIERKMAVDFADPEPQFFLKSTDIGNNVFLIKMFLPTQKALQTSSNITQDFLSFVYREKDKKERQTGRKNSI